MTHPPVSLDRSNLPVDRRTDAIDRHMHSRASPRYLAGSTDVPDTTDRPELFYVEGPPEEIWLVTSTGKRILGFSIHAEASSSLELTTSPVDVPGTLITLPKPGVYTVVAVFDFHNTDFFVVHTAIGILATEAGTAIDTPRSALFAVQGGTDGDRATVAQTWRVTTTADDETFILRASRSSIGNPTTDKTFALTPHTTIVAFSMLGGGSTASSHQHAHVDTTGRTTDDHHNEDHILTGVPHSDMEIGQLILTGDMMIRNSSGKWNRLRVGATAGHVLTGGTVPAWRTLADRLAAEDHDSLGGIEADDHHDEDHDLFSTPHTDLLLAAGEATGDIMFRNSSGKWTNLPLGANSDVLFATVLGPTWLGGDIFSTVVDHQLMTGVEADDHHTKYLDSEARTAVPFVSYISFGAEPITGQSYAP